MAHTDVPSLFDLMNPVKRRKFIKYQLELRGLNFTALARQLGVTRPSVAYAASGGPSARIHAALAEAINIPVGILFPERYGSASVPNTQPKTTRSGAGSGVKSPRAA